MPRSAASKRRTAPVQTELSLPLISVTSLLQVSPIARRTAEDILSALRTFGFFYLTGAPIPPDQIARVFSFSNHFFKIPLEDKFDLEWTTPQSNRGYSYLSREKASVGVTKEEVDADRQGEGQDMKESLEIGREGVEGFPNRWPEEHKENGLQGFRETMLEFFERCRQLHEVVMRGIALGMGFPAEYFDSFVADGDNTLRLLHYPSISASALQSGLETRAGAHTDFGSLTFLFQDDCGGLQVEKPEEPGLWIDVQPVKNAIIVNSGDLLARWSNDLIRSTLHRVIEPPDQKGSVSLEEICDKGQQVYKRGSDDKVTDVEYPARYSVAYFCNPDFDDWIEALPGTWGGEKGEKKYEGVNSGDYLAQRLEVSY